jgi:hypothetical protein
MASALLLAVLKRWGPDMTASGCKFFLLLLNSWPQLSFWPSSSDEDRDMTASACKFLNLCQIYGLSSPLGLDMTTSACKFFFTFTKFMASVLLQAILKRLGLDVRASACKFFTFTKFMASALLLAVLKRWGPDMTASACKLFFYFYQIHGFSSPSGHPQTIGFGCDGLCM